MPRRRRKLPYKEGTWFAVPLRRGGGWGVGVAARLDGGGAVFGYFFGPRLTALPSLQEVCKLRAGDAILLDQFGDLGLIEDRWPIIGECDEWLREDWPMPPFVRVDEVVGKAWMTVYSEDTLEATYEERCDPTLASHYPEDGLSGAGALEIRLTKAIEDQEHAAAEHKQGRKPKG